MNSPRGNRRRAAVLIVCLAILTVLALLAVSFARLMSLEQAASTNHVDVVRAKFLAHSGIVRSIEELRVAASGRSWDDPNIDTWIFEDTATLEETLDPSFKEGTTPYGDAYSGVLGGGASIGNPSPTAGRYEDYGDYYKLKILDTGAQININSTQSSLPALLENLGKHLQHFARSDPEYARQNPRQINPIPSVAGEDNASLPSTGRGKGLEIVQAREKLPTRRFSSKDELIPILGAAAFDAVKDYVCTHSFADPETFTVNATTVDIIDARKVIHSFSREARSPINLNTASPPVLAAVLTGLGAQIPEVSATARVQKDKELSFMEEVEMNSAAAYTEIPRLILERLPGGGTEDDARRGVPGFPRAFAFRIETREDPQEVRLSGPGFPDQADRMSGREFEVEVTQAGKSAVGDRAEVADGEVCHRKRHRAPRSSGPTDRAESERLVIRIRIRPVPGSRWGVQGSIGNVGSNLRNRFRFQL